MNQLSPEQIREISWMYLSDAVVSELEQQFSDGEISREFLDNFLQPQQDIVELFRYYIESNSIDISSILERCDSFVMKIELVINQAWAKSQYQNDNPVYLVADLADEGEIASIHREFLRAIGHGVSAWDDLFPDDYGLTGNEDYGYNEFPHDLAWEVIEKLKAHAVELDYSDPDSQGWNLTEYEQDQLNYPKQ